MRTVAAVPMARALSALWPRLEKAFNEKGCVLKKTSTLNPPSSRGPSNAAASRMVYPTRHTTSDMLASSVASLLPERACRVARRPLLVLPSTAGAGDVYEFITLIVCILPRPTRIQCQPFLPAIECTKVKTCRPYQLHHRHDHRLSFCSRSAPASLSRVLTAPAAALLAAAQPQK